MAKANFSIGATGTKGSATEMIPGTRTVKEYPVTEETLKNIGIFNFWSQIFISTSTLSAGFALSTWQALSMSTTEIHHDDAIRWQTYLVVSIFLFAIFGLLGVVFYFKSSTTVSEIKSSTKH